MQNCDVASQVNPTGQTPPMQGPLVVTDVLIHVGVAELVKHVKPTGHWPVISWIIDDETKSPTTYLQRMDHC